MPCGTHLAPCRRLFPATCSFSTKGFYAHLPASNLPSSRLPCRRRCLNPLLRSRDRQRIYCAGCRLDAVREGEQPGAPPSAPPAAAASGAAAGAAAARAPAAAIAGGASATGTAPAPLQQHGSTVEAAAAAVAARLSAATAALPAAAAERAAQLLEEVRLCAAALHALADAHEALGARPSPA